VGKRFGEDDGRAGRAGHRAHKGLELFEIAPLARKGKVALVAAGHAAEPAIARMHIAQVVGHPDQAVVHAAVAPVVVLPGVKRRAATVQDRADRALAGADQIGILVIQAEVLAQDHIEIRPHRGRIDQIQERSAPAEQVAPAVIGLVRRNVLRDAFVPDGVQRRQLPRTGRVGHGNEARQIEEVGFLGVQGF